MNLATNYVPAKTWIAFRKEISLNQKPKSAIAEIAVDIQVLPDNNGKNLIL